MNFKKRIKTIPQIYNNPTEHTCCFTTKKSNLFDCPFIINLRHSLGGELSQSD